MKKTALVKHGIEFAMKPAVRIILAILRRLVFGLQNRVRHRAVINKEPIGGENEVISHATHLVRPRA
ncbi:MAG TPA: hypothetical protein PKI90_14240, partial [bacterium]|nr:hypothetical protein [bacterium]